MYKDDKEKDGLRIGILAIIGFLILAVGAGGLTLMIVFKTKAKRKQPKALIPNVSTEPFVRLDLETKLEAMGVVIPSRKLDLGARVSGEVETLHKDYIPGGLLKKGETIILLDKTDFELKLKQAEAQLEKAKSELKLEMAQGLVAKNQYERFADGTAKTIDDKELIMRKPQERAKKADVAIAEANVEAADLDLKRADIKTPFDSVVITKNIEVGDQITSQTNLATIVGTETFWVRVSIPASKIKWLIFPNGNKLGSKAKISTKGCTKNGHIIRLLRNLEEKGRMARVLVEIKDPLSLKNKSGEYASPLLLGEYARVMLTGKVIPDVVKVPRKALHEASEIWVADADDKLRIVKANPVWQDRENLYFKQEIPPGCRLITSNFGFPVQGMQLKVVEESLEANKKPIIIDQPKKKD